MTTIMQMLVENYNELLELKKDPVIDSWLFMHSPLPVLAILVLYLYFVLHFGPNYMKNRKPFVLKNAMIFYNLYQVLFSIWLCSHALNVKNAIPHFLNHTCRNPSPNKEFQAMLANGAWWYFFSKITELLDTVFFVLRKKQSQVSFLHVYHHSVTMVGSWAYLKYLPGEQGVVIGFLNSMVHVVMYFYYFLSALGPKYQKYLWWKKYMTWMQLTQFGIMLMYLALVVVMDCKLPRALTYFFVTNVVIFIYLFSDYYIKAYSKPKRTNTQKEVENVDANEQLPIEYGIATYRVKEKTADNIISLPKDLYNKKKG
ncbi:unnamed protein product [Ceutorhynchus assimilis]|uniref:Elongation of very long chain fatty acids protein n=1 Tax=Ceutorhynchus assimilis TaxID=467358 RepID=A0A9N9M968_9CUCU|nr:unnamed protein product [Ceutorhynchus assimilis]